MNRTKWNGQAPAVYEPLPAIIDRARAKLTEARTSAEVLEAKQIADLALHVAKLRNAAIDVHADCVLLITAAERRIGDEIIAGKERGEIASEGRPTKPSTASRVSDLGLTYDQSAKYQDLARTPEEVINSAVQAEVDAGRAPTKATADKAVKAHKAKAPKAQPRKPSKEVPEGLWVEKPGELGWAPGYGPQKKAEKGSEPSTLSEDRADIDHDDERLDAWITDSLEITRGNRLVSYWCSLEGNDRLKFTRDLKSLRDQIGDVIERIEDEEQEQEQGAV
jgi:hypothetical protein